MHKKHMHLTPYYRGINFENSDSNSPSTRDTFCEACCIGKSKIRNIARGSHEKSRRRLEYIHSDVCGPFPPSYTGRRYIITFIDEFSNYTAIIPVNLKSDVFEEFKKFKVFMENQCDEKIKNFISDNGGEYCSQ